MRWIATNAGQEGNMVVAKVREMKPDMGYNAATDTYENLIEAGVIDPTKVVRFAIQNAASIAGLMLTTEAVVAEIPEKKKEPRRCLRAAGWRTTEIAIPGPVVGRPRGDRLVPRPFRVRLGNSRQCRPS